MRAPCLWYAGTNKWKFHLTTVLVIDAKTGQGIPVAWLLHKYNKGVTLCDFLNNLAVFASNSPRHAAWPAAKPHGRDTRSAAPSPATGAAAPPPPQAFLPSHVVIDVCATETGAIADCLWGGGYQGYGLPLGAPVKVGYCLWHLSMAWSKNLAAHVKSDTLRETMKAALKVLRETPVRAPTAPV